MKLIRIVSALAVCAALLCMAVGALAAPDASEVPTFEITLPESGVIGGGSTQMLVTASLPGFLTLTLTDASGAQVKALCDYREIHSGENAIYIEARDEEGEALSQGRLHGFRFDGQPVWRGIFRGDAVADDQCARSL